MLPRILVFLFTITTAAIGLLQTFPRMYCVQATHGSWFTKLKVSHEVLFWNSTHLDYRQWNKRYYYHWCTGQIQPYVLYRKLDGFYFTMDEFAAMRHIDEGDKLNMTIGGTNYLLTRCNKAQTYLPM
ncbi:hypothetical protein FOZ62_029106 [Perkinsus olseni]|uniref:Uncharacterized protein n=1 Tax=Perkinsus olseni TaxID=32597 RepID=A0A7J6R7A6_PEROL|nr:hypothetical protein FOZ62_029106 [Perkinsus olseni]